MAAVYSSTYVTFMLKSCNVLCSEECWKASLWKWLHFSRLAVQYFSTRYTAGAGAYIQLVVRWQMIDVDADEYNKSRLNVTSCCNVLTLVNTHTEREREVNFLFNRATIFLQFFFHRKSVRSCDLMAERSVYRPNCMYCCYCCRCRCVIWLPGTVLFCPYVHRKIRVYTCITGL